MRDDLQCSLIAIRLNNPHKARIWGETRCGNVLMGKSNRGNRKSPLTTTPDAISPTPAVAIALLSSSQTINCISIIQLAMQPSPASVTSITEQHNCAQTNFGDCGACNFSIGEPAARRRRERGRSQFWSSGNLKPASRPVNSLRIRLNGGCNCLSKQEGQYA